ncbi:MAG: hypothetical protein ACKVHQ_14300 [Gammaproteobacteria bacterium]
MINTPGTGPSAIGATIPAIGASLVALYCVYRAFRKTPPSVVKNQFDSRHNIKNENHGSDNNFTTQQSNVPNESSIADKYWEQASNEVSSNSRDEALWARIFAETDGDENKTKARYIKARAEKLQRNETAKLDDGGHSIELYVVKTFWTEGSLI